MKVFIVSFGPNPRVVAKFQTDRFRSFGENRGEKKTFGRLLNHIRSAAATRRSAVAGGVNNGDIKLLSACTQFSDDDDDCMTTRA